MTKNTPFSETRMTIGVDLGDHNSHFCIIDAEGEVRCDGKVPTTKLGIERQFGSFKPARIVLECGTHSPWVSRLLTGMGHECLVLDARRVALITRSNRKSDQHDARTLARMGRTDDNLALMSVITHRPAAFQEDLNVLRARDALVRARTLLINEVRSLVKGSGERLPACSSAYFAKRVAEALPPGQVAACGPLLEQIATMTRGIKEFDKTIDQMIVERYPVALLLQKVTGVGPLTSVGFVLTLFDADRFSKSRQVGPYLGLVPRRHQSGDHDPHLGITHAGNPYLRRLLVSAAHYILGPFGKASDLRSWGLNLAAKGANAKKRAVVGVARRLAVLLHHLWVTGEVYEPCRRTPAEVAA